MTDPENDPIIGVIGIPPEGPKTFRDRIRAVFRPIPSKPYTEMPVTFTLLQETRRKWLREERLNPKDIQILILGFGLRTIVENSSIQPYEGRR